MQGESVLTELIQAEARAKLFEEYWPRLHRCLAECNEEQLWERVNEHTNSIGNLVLHMEGNARQWLVHGISGMPDLRHRSAEFLVNSRVDRMALEELLSQLKADIEPLIAGLTADDLIEKRTIQGFNTSVLGALIHVIEHFSYHLGQITHMVKAMKNKDLGYYDGKDLG